MQPDEVGQYDIEWHLQSFADRSRGRFTVEHFRKGIAEQHYQLWLGVEERIKAVALTQVSDDGLDTVLLTQCAGEGAREWVYLVQGIVAWAKERGSGRFEAICRPGWEKYLKHFGFKKTHVVMELDV